MRYCKRLAICAISISFTIAYFTLFFLLRNGRKLAPWTSEKRTRFYGIVYDFCHITKGSSQQTIHHFWLCISHGFAIGSCSCSRVLYASRLWKWRSEKWRHFFKWITGNRDDPEIFIHLFETVLQLLSGWYKGKFSLSWIPHGKLMYSDFVVVYLNVVMILKSDKMYIP